MNEGESVYDYCWYPYMSASGTSSTLLMGKFRNLILLLSQWLYQFDIRKIYIYINTVVASDFHLLIRYCKLKLIWNLVNICRPHYLCFCKYSSWSSNSSLGCFFWAGTDSIFQTCTMRIKLVKFRTFSECLPKSQLPVISCSTHIWICWF